MKILILTPEVHFHSPIVMRELFENTISDGNEYCVLLTPKISSNKKSSASLKKIIINTGIKYLIFMLLLKIKYDIYQFFENCFVKSSAKRRFFSPAKACKCYNVKYRLLDKINSDESLEFIKSFSPDIILCVFFNQILSQKVLDCVKLAALNLHPSFLPEYRGMSPILWMLAEEASEGGATLHHMDSDIDTGYIISQDNFKIEDNDSFFQVYSKAALLGARLIKDIIVKGEVPSGFSQMTSSKTYRPLTEEAFEKVCKKRSLLRF